MNIDINFDILIGFIINIIYTQFCNFIYSSFMNVTQPSRAAIYSVNKLSIYLSILVYANQMTCDVAIWTQSDVRSPGLLLAQEKVSPSSDKNGEIQENFCKYLFLNKIQNSTIFVPYYYCILLRIFNYIFIVTQDKQRIIHGRAETWNLSSSVPIDIKRVSAANE